MRRATQRWATGLLAAAVLLGGCAPSAQETTVASSPPAVATTSVPLPSSGAGPSGSASTPVTPAPQAPAPPAAGAAAAALEGLRVAGRGPKTGYERSAFGPRWADIDRNGCDTRNDILRRDLTALVVRPGTSGCVVLSGLRNDPYTGEVIAFRRGGRSELDIDHVVALSNAWVSGAAAWPDSRRLQFANDPLNLLAVDSSANRQKGDGDAATWLPANKAFRCAYVSRQIAVKQAYALSVTSAEKDAMLRVLANCPNQPLPGAGS